MDKKEAKEWLLRHDFHRALTVAVADLLNTDYYEPFLNLAVKGEVTVGLRLSGRNNIRFFTTEPLESIPEPSEFIYVETGDEPVVEATETEKTEEPKKTRKAAKKVKH